jgi:hypothetical protein
MNFYRFKEGSKKTKIETAIKMLKFGEDLKKISLYTNLSMKEVLDLKKKL